MKGIKPVFLSATALLVVCSAWALDVAEEEIRSTSSTSVEFINYVGPHDRIDTIEQIKGIGRVLAASIDTGAGSADFGGKYSIRHLPGTAADALLGADVLSLHRSAGVDNIDNVRRIIAGYLESAYDYLPADALLLSWFVTVYNAVYRKRISYFESNYRRVVVDYLGPDRVGLATVYREWPGATQIVIPLTEGAELGGIGSLDSDVLTDERVIDELRSQPDGGIPDRKEITELKEREVESAQRSIDRGREALDDQRSSIDTGREEIETERDELVRERETAAERGDEERVAAIDRRQDELAAASNELDEAERAIDEQAAELDEQEQEQIERIERIQAERETIAGEEREILGQEEAVDSAAILAAVEGEEAIFFVRTTSEVGEPFSSLVYLHPESGEILLESAVNTIRGRRFLRLGNRLLVIAGEEAENRDIRLMAIDAKSLELIGAGDASVHPSSWIEAESDEAILVVIDSEETWRVGRFDDSLVLTHTSDVNVLPETMIVSTEDAVFVQDEQGRIVSLSADDLSRSAAVD